MATNTNLKANQSNVICGLGAYTHVTASTGMYFASAHCEENPASGVIITIAQSGSTTATVSSPAAAAAQNHIELQKVFNCVAGDIITVTIASSSAIDAQKNTVKSIIKVNQGQS